MRRHLELGCIVLAVSLLGGCKIELYSNLPEGEANTMLALLLLRHIDAEKEILKHDTATILVDKSQFVNAIELLRQNGLPRASVVTVQDLFPSGQLVSSPAQEQAKIVFLKEQALVNMLRGIDGVIDAEVAIAESPSPNRYDPPIPSASVFIKYSPDRNLEGRETDIRSLVLKGVPGLSPANISVVMQRADYRYLPGAPHETAAVSETAPARAPAAPRRGGWFAILLVMATALAGAAAAASVWLFRRRRTGS
ncbi:type III secretion system inner membrane ring lipoprotein SctJ [Trinickia sp. EG282A]|uniref:type III secretion system inner membrane ring lipoprotein SctJ n=1 Tax=Trinickia sp. EG282A TaxID=3237013 RepID=UPI0034D2CE1B